MSTQVSQAIARPARTAVQAVPAFVVTEFIDAVIWDMDDRQYAAVGAILLLIFGYLQVVFENKNGISFLRKINPDTVPLVNKVPDVKIADNHVSLTGTYPNPSLKVDEPVAQEVVSIPENGAQDIGDENPDLMVGEPVVPEHDLDRSSFVETEDDK